MDFTGVPGDTVFHILDYLIASMHDLLSTW